MIIIKRNIEIERVVIVLEAAMGMTRGTAAQHTRGEGGMVISRSSVAGGGVLGRGGGGELQQMRVCISHVVCIVLKIYYK